MMKVCPHCMQYYSVNSYDCDAEHRCNSGYLALDQEDRVVVGDFVGERNEPGEGEITKKPGANLQGLANKLQGTFAGIQGERLTNFTIRGAKAPTHRQRQHYEYIKFK